MATEDTLQLVEQCVNNFPHLHILAALAALRQAAARLN